MFLPLSYLMSADRDRNLLFGALARQLTLVTDDQLASAVKTWTQRDDVTLSQVLVDQHSLLRGDVKLIDQLVERSIAQHSGDITRCLQSVNNGSRSEAINELQTITTEGLEATHGWQPAQSAAGVPERERNGLPSASRFQEVVFHAQGGLGEVWKARDAELGREVALKRIRQRFSGDEESRVRFAWEAEITGNLEHPGIVPVYGFGRYADGRPYYAMRFIRGDSLKHEIDRFHAPSAKVLPAIVPQNPTFRRLLKCFIDTCNTIHFAHCAGIIHRDIKPANIMVGKFGETLVVDWGLAKKLNSPDPIDSSDVPTFRKRLRNMNESTATQLGTAVGTPAYMSPEQAAGRWDTIGPAADIYSLGATLYHLLTGQTSIQTRDFEELFARVRKGDFPPPTAINAAIPKPLSAICLKAMALEPKDRYASAQALGSDLECWLADQEVAAYQENGREKLSRWIRQNTSKVYATAGSTLVVVIAAIAIAIASRNAAVARSVADQEKAKGLARLQAEREAVDEWMTGTWQKLYEYPAAQPAREEMLKRAIEQYQTFVAEAAAGNDVLLELARHYHRLGEVQRRRGATKPEKLIDAESSFEKAESILAGLIKEPDNSAAYAQWAQTRIQQALMLADRGEYDHALKRLKASRDALGGEDDKIREAASLCLLNEGSILLSARNLKDAFERLNEATQLCDKLVDETEPGDSLAKQNRLNRRLRNQATARALSGHCRAQLGELRKGREDLEAALQVYMNLFREDQEIAFLYLEDQAMTGLALGDVLRRQAQYARAKEQFRHAIVELDRLAEQLTDVPRIRELVATAHIDAAQLALERGLPVESHSELRIAAPIIDTERQYRQTYDDFKLTSMALLDIFGEVLQDSKQTPEELGEAAAAFDEVQATATTVSPTMSREAGERAAISGSHKAQLLERQGQDEAAETHYRNALAGLEKVTDSSHTARHAKALVHAYLGDLLHRTDRADKAAAEYKQAISIWTAMAAEAEPGPQYLDRLAWLLANCRDESRRDLQLAGHYIEKTLALAPDHPGFICTAALAELRQKSPAKCIARLEPLQRSSEAAGGFQGHVLALLAMSHWQQNDQEAAKKLLAEAVEWRSSHRPGNPELRDLVQEAEKLIRDTP